MNWRVLLCFSGQSCDLLTYEMHLQALQNWTKFSTEQSNISALLHTLSPTHLLPDCYIRFFIEIKSRPRVTIWVRLKKSYSFYDCLFPGGEWSAYQKRPALCASWSLDGKLICPQNTEYLICLKVEHRMKIDCSPFVPHCVSQRKRCRSKVLFKRPQREKQLGQAEALGCMDRLYLKNLWEGRCESPPNYTLNSCWCFTLRKKIFTPTY